ncbi:acyl-CoA-binding protein (ACBP)/diazepam binding inhibitor (DBI)/endozepine (EP) [Lithohypha guttulata]|uniref:Acyl-CoA-binding protein (ACBP)/diazepam binding inhibitor (DBI)/endozepine (EP) n=1 Tax=Lithohypha guttulata TaxID=1690604 RepID=A0AAN7SV19_9EURO|nr:acyl-CoA-binding protein (ACBP)/diazepam binding inhibitor (DBI)/endozepine (EP) [Lithohypha guttulata]KAK5082262.1 acyl-CoA-binding protein (ACBP)/diazepam binding inhibitor (DBI)/endozepine (EP) [Lithohypha guttulata]KAK5105298.1 acyl-CoA-binding protein (ACBP)/diazepam binding inhibitor (DBI)/endozepine (EP) [Lithohypha guttulata]
MPSKAFNDAVTASKQLTKKPDNDELLKLYAYFKQTQQDPPIDKSPAPGTFDLKGKAKRKAWQKVVDEGMTAQQAEQNYIKLVNEMKDKYGYDPNKQPEAVGN